MSFTSKILSLLITMSFCLSFICLFAQKPLALILDKDNNVVEHPELMTKVWEVLAQDISIEMKTEMLRKLADEYGQSIVQTEPGHLNVSVYGDIEPKKVIILDTENQVVNEPEILAKVIEILDQDISKEMKSELVRKLSLESGFSIVLLGEE